MAIDSKVESKKLGRTISFRVQDDVFKIFEAQCVSSNMTKSELFREYIVKNKIYVNAKPAVSRESRRAVELLQRASDVIEELLRRSKNDGATGLLTDAYYIEFIKQLTQLNKFMLKQATGVRSDN